MRYYTIQNDSLLIAENMQALSRFYDNVKELPSDYEDNKYVVKDGELILNPDFESQKEQEERERIAKLSCTKRDFVLMLQEMGVDYFATLKPLIESNPQAQLEWELCERLYRFNPMLDLMASQLGVTSEQLDGLFKYANGEITLGEFKALKDVEDSTQETGDEVFELE